MSQAKAGTTIKVGLFERHAMKGYTDSALAIHKQVLEALAKPGKVVPDAVAPKATGGALAGIAAQEPKSAA